MFGVPKHIALKMNIKSNYVLQKTSINFTDLNFRLVRQKNEKRRKNGENFNFFSSKTP